VNFTTANANSYVVTGYSQSGNDFVITKVNGGSPSRSCTTVSTGGCPAGGATNW
jgi:hypothetical protein